MASLDLMRDERSGVVLRWDKPHDMQPLPYAVYDSDGHQIGRRFARSDQAAMAFRGAARLRRPPS